MTYPSELYKIIHIEDDSTRQRTALSQLFLLEVLSN
jgi:hypothetical protein